MRTAFLENLDLSRLAPVRIWAALPADVRAVAALAFYAQSAADDPLRPAVDAAIARTLRFRPESVKKMPAGKKASYLARVVHPDENLAAGMLQALHLEERRPLLASFLDQLGIAHENGHIDAESKLERPAADRLAAAAAKAYASFPPEEVDVYFTTLLVFDPVTWDGMLAILQKRRSA